jgi:hypothetical protein
MNLGLAGTLGPRTFRRVLAGAHHAERELLREATAGRILNQEEAAMQASYGGRYSYPVTKILSCAGLSGRTDILVCLRGGDSETSLLVIKWRSGIQTQFALRPFAVLAVRIR